MFPAAAAGSGMPGCRDAPGGRSGWSWCAAPEAAEAALTKTAAAGMVQSMVQSPQISSISIDGIFPNKNHPFLDGILLDGISPNKNHPFLDGILLRKIIYFWDFPEQKASSYWGSPGW